MKFFEASIETIIIRYYVMMSAVIIPFVIGVPTLALIAVPIFLSALMGISFNWKIAKTSKKERKASKNLNYSSVSRVAA